MNIAICFDKNYQKWATVCLNSIIKHYKSPTKIRLVILSDINYNQCIWQLRRVLKNFEFTFDNPGNDFDSMPTGYHFNVTTYWRLALPKVLTKYHIEKAIYLDLDTLVLSDLNELYNIDLAENTCGGCSDIGSKDHVESLSLTQAFAINGGVLLMDVAKMNQIDWVKESHLLNKQGRIKWVDQDVINILLDSQITLLDLKWNFQSGNFQNNYKGSVNIVHFTESGNSKPWNNKCKHPYFEIYKGFMLHCFFIKDYLFLNWPNIKKKIYKISQFELFSK